MFIQSRNLVYLLLTFDMYPRMIKISKDVKRAVLLVNTTPMLGLIIDIVEVPVADPEPIKISVIFIITLFLFTLLNFFL